MFVSVQTFDAITSETTAPESVWDGLWKNLPYTAKDEDVLTRESAGRRWGLIVDKLESAFGSVRGLRTIELGCGRGDISALLARRGAEVTLLDQSEAALAAAKRRFDHVGLSAQYVQDDILGPLGSYQGRFDVAVSLGVVEHFRGGDRAKVMAAHRNVLKPGGAAIISVPNAWCLPYRLWKLYLELTKRWPYGMEIPYSRREIAERMREVGLFRREVYGLSFWQSIGDQWYKRLCGRRFPWVDSPSRLDAAAGLVLLAFGWRDDVGVRERAAR